MSKDINVYGHIVGLYKGKFLVVEIGSSGVVSNIFYDGKQMDGITGVTIKVEVGKLTEITLKGTVNI
jgi:hypothetical protein